MNFTDYGLIQKKSLKIELTLLVHFYVTLDLGLTRLGNVFESALHFEVEVRYALHR